MRRVVFIILFIAVVVISFITCLVCANGLPAVHGGSVSGDSSIDDIINTYSGINKKAVDSYVANPEPHVSAIKNDLAAYFKKLK